MPEAACPPFAAVLLAGGFSRRMGCDKARLIFEGEALWRFQLRKLAQLGAAHRLVSCREEQKLHVEARPPEVEWLFDPPGDEQGPLAAVARALAEVNMPLVVLAVDMPRMTSAFLHEQLVSSIPAVRGCFFQTENGLEPLAALYVPSMLAVISAHLQRGQLSLQRCIEECLHQGLARVKTLEPCEQELFMNMNTLAEWQDCQLPIPA